MFNVMMDAIREESVGNLFNLEVQVQDNPIVEEAQDTTEAAQDTVPGMLFGPRAPAAGGPPAGGAMPGGMVQPGPAPAPAGAAGQAPPATFGGGAAAGGRHAGGQVPAGQAQAQPGRRRGKHAADGRGHATAAGRGQAASHSGQTGAGHGPGGAGHGAELAGPGTALPSGLEPRRPRHLQYSAPSDSGGVEHHGDTSANPYAGVGRNDPCPCGSGRKFKRCHGDPRNAAS